MAVPSYEIYISSLGDPSFHFVNNDIKEPSTMQGVDIVGDKLSIDTFTVNVYYRGEDINELRTLPFGTPIWYFENGTLVYKFYINAITRVSTIEFKLECVSAIGLLSKSSHIGGVYTGQTVSDVLEEIIGNIVEYSVDEDVASTQVFGYLPYQSRRDNLHQLMFAHNISILRDADGDMRFTYLATDGDPAEIDANRIYINGQVDYPAVATEVIVVEHSYQYDDTVDEVTLFDNTSSTPANHKRVIFDTAPIYVPSLKTTESMVIEVAHPNFVVVSGIGTVVGRPYYDNLSSISRENETDGEEYTVRISDATLVNILNSEFVANRVMSYYDSAKIVKGDIKIADEAVGHRYTFLDAFGEQVIGYLRKITTYASSFVKATSEFITGYESLWFGNNYTHYVEATEPCDIVVPEGCKRLRFVIIGGGNGGTSGGQSYVNSDWIHSSEMNPGTAGKAGNLGEGGNIREIVINNPTPGSYHCSIGVRGTGTTPYHINPNLVTLSPTASSVTCPDETVYSSDDSSAYKCASGIMNIFTGEVFGKEGKEGIDGGDGGRGSYGKGEDGEDVYYDGVLYTGGKGAKEYVFNFNHSEAVVEVGGGGGSGAMAYVNGGSARQSSTYSHVDETTARGAADYEKANLFISIPNGTTGQVPEAETNRACGGNAGCGGAAIGGPGSKGAYDDDYYDSNNKLVYRHVSTGAEPGSAYGIDDFYYIEWRLGTPGRDGGRGIIIAYADAPLEIENEEKLPTPFLTAVSGSSSSAVSFKATNVVEEKRYFVEKKILSVDPDNLALGDMNYQKYMTLGIWEPRGYFDVPSGDTEYTFTDNLGSIYYHREPKGKATYVYRIKSYGSEELGESDWSNELVIGFGLDQYDTNPIVDVMPLYIDSKLEIGVYTGSDKPVTASTAYENFQRRRASELQWYDKGKYGANGWMFRNQYDIPTGEEFEYQLFVSGPDKLSSQFSNIKNITVPEVTNRLFDPYFIRAYYDTQGTFYNHVRLMIEWLFCDERATTLRWVARIPGNDWWFNLYTWALSSLGPVGKYTSGGQTPSRSDSTQTELELKLWNEASGYSTGNTGSILTFTYPDNILLDPEQCYAYYLDGSVILVWGEVEHAASTYIYRRSYENSAWSSFTLLSNSITGQTYTDSTVSSGVRYQYQIGSMPETGYIHPAGWYFIIDATEGAWSGVLEPPTLSSEYTYETTDEGFVGYITLEWTEVQNVTGYLIERKTGDGLWIAMNNSATLPPSILEWTDRNTEFGVTYSYRVFSWGNEFTTRTNYYNPSNIETKMAVNGEPVNLTAPVFTLSVPDRFAGEVRVAWTAVADAQSYLLQRKLHSEGDSAWVDISIPYASMSYTDTATQLGQTYDYRMKSIGDGITTISSEFSEVSAIEVEDPWASLIYLTTPELTLAQVTEVNSVSASWTSVSNNSGYKLERKLSTDSIWTTIYNGSAISYTDQNLTWDVTYNYRITALGDLVTYRDSLPDSDSVHIDLPVAVQLAAPVLSGSETTSGGAKAALLSWTAVTGASSYKLERKLSTDSAYTILTSDISSTAVSYIDTAVLGGRTYQYKLTAIGDGIYYTDSNASTAVEIALTWASELLVVSDGTGQYPHSMITDIEKWMNIQGGTQTPFVGSFYYETNAFVYGYKWSDVPSGVVYYGGVRDNYVVDLTNYSVVQITIKKPSSAEAHFQKTGIGNGMVYLYVRPGTGYEGGNAQLLSLTESYETYELDVSSLSGNHYLGIQQIVTNPAKETEIWVRKIALYG